MCNKNNSQLPVYIVQKYSKYSKEIMNGFGCMELEYQYQGKITSLSKETTK